MTLVALSPEASGDSYLTQGSGQQLGLPKLPCQVSQLHRLLLDLVEEYLQWSFGNTRRNLLARSEIPKKSKIISPYNADAFVQK